MQVQIENEDMNYISDTQVRVSSASGGRAAGLLAGTDPSFTSHYQSTIHATLFHNTINSLTLYITTDFI